MSACLFDLDGVITQTAKVHAQAWKQTFDEFRIPFEIVPDYADYVDGKPRADGVQSVLTARGIEATPELVADIASKKDQHFLDLIHRDGVETYESSVSYIRQARAAGMKLAVVSSSKHTTEVLSAAALDSDFDAQVDGNLAEREHLPGKPAPDTYLAAATMLQTLPANAAVYEDALAGVEAGRAGRFGLVVGIDRAGQADALRAHGADIVVQDLAQLMNS
ncbi:MAG: beta-phosphoglucomutase family hydrolase [Chloroflexi bacterium]|nr:MAG: beta-phosphoglucomutase family hydrolase [Chloroflexota bacterium]TMG14006.1 MAG: beta-phosphoglucomutase family hydrolase [Chloroflexota bacterium]